MLSAIALGATTVRAIADRTDLTEAETARALGQLLRAGIVSQEGPGLQVDHRAFARAAREASPAAAARPRRRHARAGGGAPELRRRRRPDPELPARAAKRELVLEYVATRFEPGREYAEQQVNEILLGSTTTT